MGDLDNTVKALVTEAIFKSIDEKKREELIRTALASLLKGEGGGSWGDRGTTPLQQCFDAAARDVARDIVREHFTKDETFKAQVAGVVKEAIEKVWAGDKREQLVNAMADVIIEGMKYKHRD